MVSARNCRRLAGGLVVVCLAMSSCGSDEDAASPPTKPVDELTQHDGEFCPSTLPRAPQDTYGFGTGERAESKPSLWAPQEAWICHYAPADVAPRGANGAWYEWVRQGQPRQLRESELKAFASALLKLEPAETGGSCTADLGARYLVSYAHDNDLTGVVIDTYGCDEIRLTDEPFDTVPGDASQPGTVPGVLFGPASLLEELNVR